MELTLPEGYTLVQDFGEEGTGDKAIRLAVAKTPDTLTGDDWHDLIICNNGGTLVFNFCLPEEALEMVSGVSPEQDLSDGVRRLSGIIEDIREIDCLLALYISDAIGFARAGLTSIDEEQE